MAGLENSIIPAVKEVAENPSIQISTADDASETPTSSSDNDYIVELRAPKRNNRKKKSSKKFMLFLKHASSSECDSASSSECDSDGSILDKPMLQRSPPSLPTEGIESRQEDSCTQDNWKSFFSYAKRDNKSGLFVVSNPQEFEQKQAMKSPTGLGLTKLNDNDVELVIRSPYLQKQFRKVVKIEDYHSVSLSTSEICLTGDFIPLYHHIDDMKFNVAADSEASLSDRAHMDALYYFHTVGWPAKKHEDARNNISQGLITYSELGALFKPGDFAVHKDLLALYTISKISSVKLERPPSPPGSIQRQIWFITLHSVAWSGGKFKQTQTRRQVNFFDGTIRITDLDFYPLSHHQSGDELRDAAIERGKTWKQSCESDPRVMSYQGQALPSLIDRDQFENGLNSGVEAIPFNFLSTVIVDSGWRSKGAMQASVDGKRFLYATSYNTNPEVTKFTEDEFMICSPFLEVFSLDDQDWYHVEIAGLKPKDWKPRAFDRLVLDQYHKENLLRLAKNNSRLVQSSKSNDIIEGKGKGIVLLLHGPPGVGKTLTAEALSEYTKRPLLKVNLGKVATHRKWEQALEQIFSNAEEWKAILLIDEAEIVLEKRTFERMTQNSWISVFLRKLEYYKGILILTTNLIHCMDEAFESRISYPIQFSNLSRDDRHRIWSDFIKEMTMLPAYKKTLINEVDRWSEAEINGRQIRNIILMAENMAASDENHPRLLPKHIDEMLNVTLEFCDYNRESPARVKKLQFTGPSY